MSWLVMYNMYYIHTNVISIYLSTSIGYVLHEDGSNCTDIDECANEDMCKFGECINKDGSFECVCPPDFALLASGNACIGKSLYGIR